ncbi:glycosyltransferase family 2 protein [Paracoccus beibuensis]|uniref:glycosyltransferase family 2 protein n=1 Tax=Paracoccus beibuensis TaxID=547602 RepID=UPI00223F6969|nr:glycosyltransferase family 2 protein [Paracoccus beibuensis]
MNKVAVIIPAHDASRTIAQAIRSALAEPEVAEVVIVDDASNDDTAAVARTVDDGSGRLRVMALAKNVGPAEARNLAIGASTAPWIAILDSDDAFLPGRFRRLFAYQGWDLAADNVALVPDRLRDDPAALTVPQFADDPQILSLTRFIAGNLASGRMGRNETGLLKPVISRDVLTRTGLHYDRTLRLGEDFILYVRLMAQGARFLTIRSCGYVAFQRGNSLSARHRTDDLGSFSRAARQILSDDPLPPDARDMLAKQELLTRNKYHHRLFLDRKSSGGLGHAAAQALRDPARIWPILLLTARDKRLALMQRLGLAAVPHDAVKVRYLLDARADGR